MTVTVTATEKQNRMPDDFSRYGGAVSQMPKFEPPELSQPNPDYPYGHAAGGGGNYAAVPGGRGGGGSDDEDYEDGNSPWYDPRGWSKCTILIVLGVVAAVIIAVVVGAVEGTKKNRYPDYSKLNYRLVEEYSGTTFFDKFDYYSGEDPTHGFVQ